MPELNNVGNQDPDLPIVSSQNLGWTNLVVEEYRQLSGEMQMQPEADPVMVMSLSSQPHRIHQTMGSRRYTGLYRQGDLCITPTGLSSGYCAEGEDHYLYVQISSVFLQKVAEEALEPNTGQVELLPNFQIRNPQIESLLKLLQTETRQGGRMGSLYNESLTNALAVSLLQGHSSTQPRIAQYEGGLSDRKLLLATRYIADTLEQNIKLADLAQLVGISQSHFSRLFKQSMQLTPYQYLLQQRIERAKQLLKQTQRPLIEIALACGFDSHSHFSRQFRRATGMTPKAYRTH